MSAAPVKEPSWHANLPQPKATATPVSSDELLALIMDHRKSLISDPTAEAKFLVIDVRRTDFEDSFIVGAVNLPAQSFHQTLPSLLPILSRYDIVIFHCSSSNGRGPRVASYYQDFLSERGITKSKAGVLVGGVKEWTSKYSQDSTLVAKL